MSKVSKNIKRLRTERKMTQQELAEKIHITRQTVSSWETDRTQPDVEILGAIAQAFGVELEELIYGKKRRKDGEEKPSYNNTLVVVLSIIGCLLIAAGAVMIFVKYWKEFPGWLKLIFCFMPALLGQSFGAFTFFKKRNSVPWCEGSSVLWVLGVIATTYMLMNSSDFIRFFTDGFNNGIFNLIMGALLFCIVPLLKSFTPMIAFFVYSFIGSYWLYTDVGFSMGAVENTTTEIAEFIFTTLLYFAVIIAGLLISSSCFKKEDNTVRYTFFSWISFAVITAMPILPLMHSEFTLIPTVFMCLFACYFFIGEMQKDFFSPFRFFALPLSVIMLIFFSTGVMSDGDYLTGIISLILSVVPLVSVVYKKTRPNNILLTVYGTLLCATNFLYAVTNIILTYWQEISQYEWELDENIFLSILNGITSWAGFICVIAALVILIVHGAKERRLYYINLGFIGACTVVIIKLAMLKLGLIGTGLLLIACGAALLIVNLKFSKLKIKEELEKQRQLETENSEEEIQ